MEKVFAFFKILFSCNQHWLLAWVVAQLHFHVVSIVTLALLSSCRNLRLRVLHSFAVVGVVLFLAWFDERLSGMWPLDFCQIYV